ncbi:MAG: Gfo/Idh/MocA family oxidoreductase [Candidatus Hydrogenedentes bacterium]|nr:Gfo/Idh/MocA family oxidoreductase [Candidatus Hydrogenedentota bacterium]
MKQTGITRRKFISLSAALAAGVAAGAPRAAARTLGANDRIRLGIIGMGNRGMQLLREATAKSASLNVRVAAVCDIFEPRKLRAQAASGGELLHRWQDLVERPDIDAVVIATPDHWHAPIAIAAMQSGKDVYCEKPMAHSIEEARAFRDAAATTKRVVQIGSQSASEPQWHAAHEIVASGKLGPILWSQENYRPRAAQAQVAQDFRDVTPATLDWDAFVGSAEKRPFTEDRYLGWRKYWDYSGGVATDQHYEKLAGLMVALGAEFPVRVSAAGGVYAQDGREAPDSFVVTCEFPNSRTVVLASSAASAGELPAVIRGREATMYVAESGLTIEAEYEFRKDVQARFGQERGIELPAGEREEHFDNWVRCIRTREKCVCDEEMSYRTMVAIGMGVEAFKQGRTLYFDPATEQVVLGRAHHRVA